MSKVDFSQRLLEDLVAVEIEPAQAKTTIQLVSWARSLRGFVRAIGPGKMLNNGKRAPMTVKVGDYVTFGPATGLDTSYGGVAMRLMKDPDVDAVLPKPRKRVRTS